MTYRSRFAAPVGERRSRVKPVERRIACEHRIYYDLGWLGGEKGYQTIVSMPVISDARLRPDANNLTLVRLVLASAVIYSHSFEWVAGTPGVDGFSTALGATLATHAVDGFFAVSGFLVWRSLVTSGSARRFALARATRLWPGLIVMLLVTLAAGALLTTATVGNYASNAETWRYATVNASLMASAFTLPGIDCGGQPCAINGSLWTLPWEVRCYLVLVALALVGLANRKAMTRFVLPATLLFALLWDVSGVPAWTQSMFGHGLAYNLDLWDRLWTAFAIGIAAYEYRDRLRLSWVACAGLFVIDLAVQRWLPSAGTHVRALTVTYAALCLAFASGRGFSARWPDYSYGIYIYAFPVMVVLVRFVDWPSPYLLGLANLAATLPLAAASWHWIEKPALDRLRRRQSTAWKTSREPETA